jgi:SAM-dependent methyltransferase
MGKMSEPIYITKVEKREPHYRLGITLQLPLFDKGQYQWFREKYGSTQFTIPKLRSAGEKLFYELCQAIEQRDEPLIGKILPELTRHCIKPHDEKLEVEKWGDMALQLPGDWGPLGEKKRRLKEMITQRSSGRALEAMCGFHSYFATSKNITEVIALDFCEEALERYEYPERTRILFDLERVVQGDKLDFFKDSSFRTIGVFFGIDYLTDPVPIHGEFYRILSDDGKLLVVGGTTQGYKDMLKRMFRPVDCAKSMESAGFLTKIEHLPLKTATELGEYYLVEGRK